MARAAFREIVYRLTPRAGERPKHLPLLLAEGTSSLTVETRVAHLDETGHVWRILHVLGNGPELEQAAKRFAAFRAPFLVEKSVMGRTRHRLVLWYKYRLPKGKDAFSHTGLAFQVLGADTVITDETRASLLTIRILTRAGPALQRFLRLAEERSAAQFHFQLLYAGPARAQADARLAPEEDEALRMAWSSGYFEVPRGSGLRDLSRRLGASPSAVGYRLRRAQAKLIRSHLDAGDMH